MKLIKSIVRPNKVDEVKDALAKLNIAGMMSCSRARSSDSRMVTSFCARSRDSLVVRPSFHNSCWRANV